ncbi:MAG: MoaD/ThiS family protein [Chloroflexi bacterium]|nr:MoaD/ThiS family protein [Chloroflexota bacterium]
MPDQASTVTRRRTPHRRTAAGPRTRVVYIGPLRATVGKGEETTALPTGATVTDLLAHLIETYGAPFRDRVMDREGQLLPNIHLFLDGEELGEQGLDTPLPQRGEMSLLMMLHPMEGG